MLMRDFLGTGFRRSLSVSLGWEVTVNVYGVAVAIPQGQLPKCGA